MGDKVIEQIILIVDDQPANLDVIRAFLKEHDFRILVAPGGEAALSRVTHIKPDLILLDVLMPDIDGFETCKRLKEMEGIKDVPVIFMSALTDSEHKTKGFSLGAVDFITKPVRKEELLARVNTHLEIMRYRIYLEEEVARRTAELERGEEEYRLLFDNANDAIFIFKGGKCVKCNIKALELFQAGKDDIIDKAPFFSFLPEKQLNGSRTEVLLKDILEGRGKKVELYLLKGDQTLFFAELSSNRIELADFDCRQVIVRDISEKRKMKEIERALVQSAKLAEIGALTAGIVHEIKNPLAAIDQTRQNIVNRLLDGTLPKNLELAAELELSFELMKEYLVKRNIDVMLEDIADSCERMKRIITNMLTFSRKTQVKYDRYSIKELLHETMKLAQFNHDLAAIRDIQIEEEEELPDIYCIKSEIEQVFLNILNNGAQAMRDYERGRAGYHPSFQIRLTSDGEMVYISFKDNGPGIDSTIIDKVFELFFTTKSVERGTGLGLYICRQIIEENHRGMMEIKSSPGNGAEVRIALPINQTDMD